MPLSSQSAPTCRAWIAVTRGPRRPAPALLAQPRPQSQNAVDRALGLRALELSGLQLLLQRLSRRRGVGVVRVEEQVGAGLRGVHAHRDRAAEVVDRRRLQGIGDGNSVEADPTPQLAGGDLLRRYR